jgi:membrane-bound ClpP family serine protease
MIEWVIVISLVALGLLLLVAEIIFIPGTTLVGLLGFVFLAVGISLSFNYFGSTTGWVTAGFSAIASLVALYFSFNSKLWKRFSLKSTNHTKVNEGILKGIEVGQEGTAVSALRPIGKAELGTQQFEVKTQGEYLDSGTKIKIVKIELNQITVAPTT